MSKNDPKEADGATAKEAPSSVPPVKDMLVSAKRGTMMSVAKVKIMIGNDQAIEIGKPIPKDFIGQLVRDVHYEDMFVSD